MTTLGGGFEGLRLGNLLLVEEDGALEAAIAIVTREGGARGGSTIIGVGAEGALEEEGLGGGTEACAKSTRIEATPVVSAIPFTRFDDARMRLSAVQT